MTEIFDDILCGISVNILGGSFISHTSSWTETKTKAFYTLWNITKGDTTVTVGGRDHLATRGDAVLFSPGDTYSARSEKGCSFTFLFFTIETGNSLDLLSGLNPSGVISKEYIGDSVISFSRSFTEQRSAQRRGDLKLYSEFLAYISEIIQATRKGGCDRFNEGELVVDSDMRATLDFINRSYVDNPSVKELAKRQGLSEKYFITKFKSVMGVSPRHYILRRKMKKALELISSTDAKLSEIGAQLGYSDQYALSKAFKKFYGEAPTSYRKSNTTEK